MANRLIRYDAALLRRSVADGFRGPADTLLLALVTAIGIAWLRQQVLVLPPGAIWVALLAAPGAFAWHRLAAQRLDRLAEHSAVAPAALEPLERRSYLGLAHLLAIVPLLAGAILLGIAAARPMPAIGLAVAGYAVGAGLASVLPALRLRAGPVRSRPSVTPLGNRSSAVIGLVLARQTLGTRYPLVRAGLLVLATFALTLMAGWWGGSLPAPLPFALPLLPSLAMLLLATRLDAALLAFLPAAGYRPGFIALAVSALPAGSLLAAAAAILVTGPSLGLLAILALAHLAFILVGIARAWLYPGRTARSVDFQLQLEFAGLIAAAILLPPLAIAAAAWRFWSFYRHCRAMRWTQA